MASQNRFSREGFTQIPGTSSPPLRNPNNTTIEIPLTDINDTAKASKPNAYLSPSDNNRPLEQNHNEKAGLFHRNVAGRRKTQSSGPAYTGDDGEEDTITKMGMIYNQILNFSLVTRYVLYVLPLALILAIPIVIDATAGKHLKLGDVRLVWIFSWIEIVWLSIWISKLAAKCLPAVFQFLCGIVSSGTRKYALVLKNLEIPLSLCGWAIVSFATFIPIMTHNPTQRSLRDTSVKKWEGVVQKILTAALKSSVVILAEKFLIQLISIGYHRKQFDAKIKDSKRNIYLLSLLYDASRALFPAYCSEFADEDYVINDSINTSKTRTRTGHRQSGTRTPLRLLQNVGRLGDNITSAFGNIAQEVTGKQVFNPTSAHSIVVEALEKNKSSEALAKRLWMSFVVEGKDALYPHDIAEVLGPDRRAEAEECFACLDRDGNGDVSLDEMILTVCEFGRERHSIAQSLHDVDQAIKALDGLLCILVFIICAYFFVGYLSPSSTSEFLSYGTTLLSLSFVFATSAQEVLGSCIFLFVKHPFDVFDRVDIGDDQLIVEQISLLYTVFKKVNTHKMTQVPNIVLNTQWIQNVSRSKAMREQLLIYIHFDTTLEDIQLLRNEMQAFVLDKDNCRDFQPDVEVEVTGISEMNKLELKVEIRHKSNWANETVRAARRSKFMCALVLALRKIPIYAPGGGDAALGSNDKPTYSVAVSDAEAAANREAFARTKEAKRLVPTRKAEESKSEEEPTRGLASGTNGPNPQNGHDSATPSPLRYRGSTYHEKMALEALNARHPAEDAADDPADLNEADVRSSGSSTPQDPRRSANIEEVRGLLRRQSTQGKRKPLSTDSSTASSVLNRSSSRTETEYGSYPPQTLNPYLQRANRYPTSPDHPVNSEEAHSPAPPLQQVPEIRHPVPGSGNAFAQQVRQDQQQQLRQPQLPPLSPQQPQQQHQPAPHP